jgi:hypothetical protein
VDVVGKPVVPHRGQIRQWWTYRGSTNRRKSMWLEVFGISHGGYAAGPLEPAIPPVIATLMSEKLNGTCVVTRSGRRRAQPDAPAAADPGNQ